MNEKFIKSIEKILAGKISKIESLSGGTNNRTFSVVFNDKEYVARTEEGFGFQLKRAFNAQVIAKEIDAEVPMVIAHNFDSKEDGFWSVEEKLNGEHFYLNKMNDDDARSASKDLGKQFKLLHSYKFDRFGLIPPYPYRNYGEWELNASDEVKVSEELTGPVFKKFIEYKEYLKRRLENAIVAGNINPIYFSDLRELYDHFDYSGGPVFCGGDTRTSNILVENGHIKGIIDMEWAYGGDPASHIAAWSSSSDNAKYLDYFLEGYGSENIDDLKKKILMYEVLDFVNTINSYKDMNDQVGIDVSRIKLESLIAKKAWQNY